MKLVLVTAPAKAADAIAETLVSENLAACVSCTDGVRSVYRWKGAVERAHEVQLVIKTSDETLAALASRVRELHPYETPEIVAIDVAWALPEYAAWVRAETFRG